MFKQRRLAIILVAIISLTAIACNRQSSGGKSSSAPPDLSNTLVTRLPEDTQGFLHWNSKHPAYQRLLRSAWAGSNSVGLPDEVEQHDQGKLLLILQRVGLDLSNQEIWGQFFSEAVAFVSPAPDASTPPAIAIVFSSDTALKLDAKLKQLQLELSKEYPNVQALEMKSHSGFRFHVPEEAAAPAANTPADPNMKKEPPREFFVGWSGNTGVIATESWALPEVLSASSKSLPKIATSDEFRTATKGFPPDEARFVTGYLAAERIRSHWDALIQKSGLDNSAGDSLPSMGSLKAVALSSAMLSAPEYEARFFRGETPSEGASLMKAMSASSSQEILAAISDNPLVFLSLDAATIAQLKTQMLESLRAKKSPAAEALASQLAFVDKLKRIGVTARMAPIGQAILPLPDIMLMLESTDPAATQNHLLSFVRSTLQSSGMGGLDWQDKEIGGAPAKMLISPMGIGVFLVSKGSLVIASTSEAQLAEALAAIDKKQSAFLAKIPSRVKTSLNGSDSVANFYLNFQELGSLMENMGGVLSMYAPQNEGAKQLLDPANIQTTKKMGLMVGTISLEESVVTLKSFYQAMQMQSAALKNPEIRSPKHAS